MESEIDNIIGSTELSVQYASDIHLEFYKIKKIPYITKIAAPYLALCGDIGYPFTEHYFKFIEDCSKKFKMIFILSGNHEYYQVRCKIKTMEQVEAQILKVCSSFENVYYLQNAFVALDKNEKFLSYSSVFKLIPPETKYLVAGSTLWSKIPQDKHGLVFSNMNDYIRIYKRVSNGNTNITITVPDINELHKNSVKWIEDLKDFLNDNKTPISVLMLTHHAPSFKMIQSKYSSDPLNCAYATNLDYLMGSPIKAWISGHTHTCITVSIEKTLCSSNCRGHGDGLVEAFREDKIITF